MRLVVLAAALLLLAGCTDDPSGSDDAWRQSDNRLNTGGVVWASGSVVHTQDGTIETGVAISTYVVAGDGVYFTEDDDPEDPADAWTAELQYADRDGSTVEGTGVDILVHTLRASPDGRYLAALDVGSGEKDQYGTRQAELVVWDLRSGEERVRTTQGMGDPETDDFAALYPDVELDIPAVTDDTAYVKVLGLWAYDLATGNGDELPDDAEVPTYDALYLDSPDGSWRISDREREPRLLGPEDQRVAPGPTSEQLRLWGWLDDRYAYGVRFAATPVLVICTVPSGDCRDVAGTAGKKVLFPNEAVNGGGIDLAEVRPV